MAKGEHIEPPKLSDEDREVFKYTFDLSYEDFLHDDAITKHLELEPPVP
ncbi:MAG: hypothetical protein KatS3mg082_1404 [Nitrospiraceae bacterium]|nr:MAG: hypothetical protein KatS3mg082_1404 [Nitrospiraceae bacterium]